MLSHEKAENCKSSNNKKKTREHLTNNAIGETTKSQAEQNMQLNLTSSSPWSRRIRRHSRQRLNDGNSNKDFIEIRESRTVKVRAFKDCIGLKICI